MFHTIDTLSYIEAISDAKKNHMKKNPLHITDKLHTLANQQKWQNRQESGKPIGFGFGLVFPQGSTKEVRPGWGMKWLAGAGNINAVGKVR
jgi:hypothetical protein